MAERIHIGMLRERIAVEVADEREQSESGVIQPRWRVLATLWARSVPAGGSERLDADRIVRETARDFTIRRRKDLTTKMRILWDSLEWNIVDIQQSEDREWTFVRASRVQ